MPSLYTRPYHPSDLPAILDLFLSVRPPEWLSDYPSANDWHELLDDPVVRTDTQLWIEDFQVHPAVGLPNAGSAVQLRTNNQLVQLRTNTEMRPNGAVKAVALVDTGNNLVWETDPECARELENAIVEWGRACILRRMAENGEQITLDAFSRADDPARIDMLQRHGFVPTGDTSLRMRRALAEPISAATLPPGFSIRPLDGEREVGALVALHRAAFGTDYMTVERRLAIMRAPEYDSTMDLVAVAPDGRLAAYCTCTVHAEENARTGKREGSTDPVATHPAFQRLGLARALLLSGLALLRQRGMETVWLGTSGANVGMQRAAEAAGFHINSIVLWFQMALEKVDSGLSTL